MCRVCILLIHRKDLVLLNLINSYLDLCKINVCIIKLSIKCNTGSWCEFIAGGIDLGNKYSRVDGQVMNKSYFQTLEK